MLQFQKSKLKNKAEEEGEDGGIFSFLSEETLTCFSLFFGFFLFFFLGLLGWLGGFYEMRREDELLSIDIRPTKIHNPQSRSQQISSKDLLQFFCKLNYKARNCKVKNQIKKTKGESINKVYTNLKDYNTGIIVLILEVGGFYYIQ